MLLSIDLESKQPIYLQIRNGVVEGIASGKLKEGDTLPPVRSLASELGINLHTVNKAYQMLKLEGFVKMLRNRGTVISAGALGRDSKDFMEAATENLKHIVSEAITRSVRREQLIGIINSLYNELEDENNE
ncbi:putative transcriptional regulator [Desulfosporosinus orientis DSM 765]|uniref:Putative transcriptional regulator n=1 Tax=Desulfosporosinus orientis (strain ATCC 19365 / DSM 765 / NCIMB 8382 / VKM B-1628 / Singapore I) TaxID=768706 RepID=G7W9B8_DESOD|nr:GntR family transcriptional regulator [Desulfosporosinus orientis]AET69255.1 putative transcriptional regulator [Desulfosporosinus orientis DSM 765]